MGEQARARRRRWLLACGAAAVLIVGGVIVVKSVVLRDRARAVSTDQALDRFRAEVSISATTIATTAITTDHTTVTTIAPSTTTSVVAEVTSTLAAPITTAAPVEPVPLVEPGVYRYATIGGEQIDALDGTRHEYPPETTITVVPHDCGVSLRWEPLRERWDEWHLCATPAGIELQPDGVQYHEFFGRAAHEAVRCDAPLPLLPAMLGDEAAVQQTCTLADDPWAPLWTTLGTASRTVEGQPVEVHQVRMRIDDNDEYWEHTTIDWYLTADGLPVAVSATKSSLSPSPIGPVQYDETYELELLSLTPLR